MPRDCRVPHGAVSFSLTGGFKSRLRLGLGMESLLTRGVCCGRFTSMACDSKDGGRMRRVTEYCGPNEGVNLRTVCGFWVVEVVEYLFGGAEGGSRRSMFL